MAMTELPAAPNKSTDTPDEFSTKADAFVAALPGFVTEANDLETNVVAKEATASAAASAASDSADEAAASAASAVAAPGTNATSATSLSFGTGSKILSVETGKDFVVGTKVIIARTAAPASFMYGTVTDYDSGTGALTVTSEYASTTGTYAAWTVSLTGPRAQMLGDGQTWQNMTSSRALSVTYTNSTGRTIVVAVKMQCTAIGWSFYAAVGSAMPVYFARVSSDINDDESFLLIVPPGNTYGCSGSHCSISTWYELR